MQRVFFCKKIGYIIKMDKQTTSANVQVLRVEDTIHTADSVEWCPNAPSQHVFVCANYQLASDTSEVKTKRFGKIRLYSIDKNFELKLHQIIDNEAVLDQKWCHNTINGESYLGVVSAKNTLEIYRLDTTTIKLYFVTSFHSDTPDVDDDILMLSLDWNTGKHYSEAPTIVTSDSKGCISLFEFKHDTLHLKLTWSAHKYEAWICAFYYWDTSIVFSGGDDDKFLTFDVRENNTKPINKCNEYTAGVTSIHSNQSKEHLVAVGSYDSYLHLWDIRNMKTSVSNLRMPDSVWRLKWNPNDYNFLLAACMRQGFHVVNATNQKLNIVSSYYEHEDIAYGCDWKYIEEESLTEAFSCCYIFGACSFYDHKLSLAKVDLSDLFYSKE